MFLKARVISIALVAMLPTVTHAHDIYTNLTNRSGKSCCGGSDCRPARFRIGSLGAVEMLIDQQWLGYPRSRSNTVFWTATPVRQTGGTGAVSK